MLLLWCRPLMQPPYNHVSAHTAFARGTAVSYYVIAMRLRLLCDCDCYAIAIVMRLRSSCDCYAIVIAM